MAKESLATLKAEQTQLPSEKLLQFPWVQERHLFNLTIAEDRLLDLVNEADQPNKSKFRQQNEHTEDDNLYKYLFQDDIEAIENDKLLIQKPTWEVVDIDIEECHENIDDQLEIQMNIVSDSEGEQAMLEKLVLDDLLEKNSTEDFYLENNKGYEHIDRIIIDNLKKKMSTDQMVNMLQYNQLRQKTLGGDNLNEQQQITFDSLQKEIENVNQQLQEQLMQKNILGDSILSPDEIKLLSLQKIEFGDDDLQIKSQQEILREKSEILPEHEQKLMQAMENRYNNNQQEMKVLKELLKKKENGELSKEEEDELHLQNNKNPKLSARIEKELLTIKFKNKFNQNITQKKESKNNTMEHLKMNISKALNEYKEEEKANLTKTYDMITDDDELTAYRKRVSNLNQVKKEI